MAYDIESTSDFFLELDALKQIDRRTYISGGERVENSAEHSWHLAIACWSLANSLALPVSHEKLLKLALVHDLGEMDAGDTFLYADDRQDAHHAERSSIQRLQAHPGNSLQDLAALWEEQETGNSREARLLKMVDRLLPFLHNLTSEGRAWRDHGICQSQVLQAHAFIEKDFPDIHAWMLKNIQRAVEQGWLQAD